MEDGENEGEDAPKTDENGESKPEPKNSQDAKVEPAPEEKKDDEANQIDSAAAPVEAKDDEEVSIDERDVEQHEEYCLSQQDENDKFVNPYEHEEVCMLEINSKSKAKCLKKVILDKTKLTKANIIFYRATNDKTTGVVLQGGPKSQQTTPPQLWA